MAPVDPGAPEPKKTVSNAIAAVATYVPTEIIAIYTFVIGTLHVEGTASGTGAAPLPVEVFWAFLGAIPLFVWLVYAVRNVEERRRVPWSWKTWPYWEMASATVAFSIWSATLPRSALSTYPWYDSSVSAILLVIVSLVLPLVGVLVTKQQEAQ